MQHPKYGPGHHLHPIHANQVAKRPWGWRAAVVREYADHRFTVDYLTEDGSLVGWHHADLPIAVGTLVRVHEQYYTLDVAGAWFNIEKLSPGLGPVPEPEHPDLWAPERQMVVTDVATGRGIAPPPGGASPSA